MPKSSRTICSICLEPVKSRAKLPCKHKFCYECIKKNQQYNNRCPNCRQSYIKYRHKKKTKYTDLSNEMKDTISIMTSRYIMSPTYRIVVDLLYQNGSRFSRSRFLLIRDTLKILLSSEVCMERDLLNHLHDHMNNIVSINTPDTS
jgi:hypothetical protein